MAGGAADLERLELLRFRARGATQQQHLSAFIQIRKGNFRPILQQRRVSLHQVETLGMTESEYGVSHCLYFRQT